MKTNLSIGIIAEDESDIDCIKILSRKILNDKTIGFRDHAAHGGGNMLRKLSPWAKDLSLKGCQYLIIVHDRDKANENVLRKKLEDALGITPIQNHIICIPIEELEAWLLTDEAAIKLFCKSNKLTPSLPSQPELIDSPKEFLGKVISQSSQNKIDYVNNVHNKKIAEQINIELIADRCPAFCPLQSFIESIGKHDAQ